MPAPNEYSWYKWFPLKAMCSVRFASLTFAQEGFYRRFYDLASLAQPSSRRGFVYEHEQPASMKQIAFMLRCRTHQAQSFLKTLQEKGLVVQDEHGAWGISNFAKHQRTAHLRVRKDGMGSAEIGAELAQDWRGIGAIDAEADTEAYKEDALKGKGISSRNLSKPLKPLNPATQTTAVDMFIFETVKPWHDREQFKTPLEDGYLARLKRIGYEFGVWILKETFDEVAQRVPPHTPAHFWERLKERIEEQDQIRTTSDRPPRQGLTSLAEGFADVDALFKREPDPGPDA